jgi:hypothetical protein
MIAVSWPLPLRQKIGALLRPIPWLSGYLSQEKNATVASNYPFLSA